MKNLPKMTDMNLRDWYAGLAMQALVQKYGIREDEEDAVSHVELMDMAWSIASSMVYDSAAYAEMDREDEKSDAPDTWDYNYPKSLGDPEESELLEEPPTPEPEPVTYSLDDFRDRMRVLAKANKRDELRSILKSFNVDRLTEVSNADFPELHARLLDLEGGE